MRALLAASAYRGLPRGRIRFRARNWVPRSLGRLALRVFGVGALRGVEMQKARAFGEPSGLQVVGYFHHISHFDRKLSNVSNGLWLVPLLGEHGVRLVEPVFVGVHRAVAGERARLIAA